MGDKESPLLAVKLTPKLTVDIFGSRVQGRKHYFAADSLIVSGLRCDISVCSRWHKLRGQKVGREE